MRFRGLLKRFRMYTPPRTFGLVHAVENLEMLDRCNLHEQSLVAYSGFTFITPLPQESLADHWRRE